MKGTIKQRTPGSWEIKYDLPRVEGKRRQKSVTVRGTKKEAQAHLARLLVEQEGGALLGARTTVAQLLTKWLTEHCEAHWEATPLRAAKSGIRVHLIPALGHHRITELKPLHVQEYYSAKRPHLSEQTLLHHHKFLKQAFAHAVRWELVTKNVMERVTPPRVRSEATHAFTQEQCALMLREAQEPLRLAILIALATGMRRGEIVGLRWQDVDLKNGRLKVRQTMTDRGSTKPPKTVKGRRVITIPSVGVDELAQAKGRSNSPYVVSWEDGRPVRSDYLTRGFQDLAKRLKLPSTRFHDLRHTHASHLLSMGLDVVSVSDRMGHSSATVTLRVYAHSVPGTQDRAAALMDGVLRPVTED